MVERKLKFTQKEVDEIVAAGRPLFRLSGGYTTWNDVEFDQRVGDWKLQIINSRGTGNNGELVATPTTARSGNIFRQGKIRQMVDKLGATQEVAELYVKHTASMSYVWESRVMEMVVQLMGKITPAQWYTIKEARSTRIGFQLAGIDPSDLSVHRLDSVHALLGRMMFGGVV